MRQTTAIAAGLVLAMGLASCSSVGTGRERIVRAPRVCQDVTIPAYFEANDAEITREGRRVGAAGAARAKGCSVDAVRVLGLADAAGEPAANLELSQRRAASVADAIQ